MENKNYWIKQKKKIEKKICNTLCYASPLKESFQNEKRKSEILKNEDNFISISEKKNRAKNEKFEKIENSLPD